MVAAGIQAPPVVTASLAGVSVFIGGFRQLFNDTERHVLVTETWSRLRTAVQRYHLVPEAERDEASRQLLLEHVAGPPTAVDSNWPRYPGISRRPRVSSPA